MPFEYSCFISFRHSPHESAQKMVDKIYEKLSAELHYYNKRVFLDKERLKKGDILNPSIAFALCRSACMVMIYVPNYWDENHTWCAREYKAMLKLEKQRLKSLASNEMNHGLIIPIICRTNKVLPSELTNRVYFDWSTLTIKPGYAKTNQFNKDLKELADIVIDRCESLDSLGDLCGDCENFTLPEEKEIKEWFKSGNVNNQLVTQPFPGRGK